MVEFVADFGECMSAAVEPFLVTTSRSLKGKATGWALDIDWVIESGREFAASLC